MSGHSKWAKLKHSKGAIDAKKSAMFTRLGHGITIAAKEGGGDPESNFKLRMAIEKAKKANMPKQNIEKAIKRGTGELGGEQIEEVLYEAFGPEKTAIIIQTLTDNKNRTVSNMRRILNKHGGSLGAQNSVLWMFDKKGIIRISDYKEKIQDLDEFQLKSIDLGAQDIKIEDNDLAIYTNPEDLDKVKKDLNQDDIIDYAETEWFAKDYINIGESAQKKINNILNELDDEPDVSDYYTNIK